MKSTFKKTKENDTLYFDGYREPDPKFARTLKELKKQNG